VGEKCVCGVIILLKAVSETRGGSSSKEFSCLTKHLLERGEKKKKSVTELKLKTRKNLGI